MRTLRQLLMFMLLTVLSVTARNQDTRNMESPANGVVMVKAVYVDSAGVKWFGTNRGLYRFDYLIWQYYNESDYLVGNQVNALTFEQSDSGSVLWVATTQGVSRVQLNAFGIMASTGYTTDNGLLNNDVASIAIDSRNGKFFGSEDGITWYHDGTMDSIRSDLYYGSMLNTPVRQMDIWGDTLYIAQEGGIGRLVSGVDGITGASRWTSEFGMTPFSGNIRSVKVLGMDKQWFGTDEGVELHAGYSAKEKWSILSTDDGLVNNDVISIFEDASGGLWFGTFGGVSNYSDGVWSNYTTENGLASDTVYTVAEDPDGSLWFGTHRGLSHLVGSSFENFLTGEREPAAEPVNMAAWFNRHYSEITVRFQVQRSGPVMAEIWSAEGKLLFSKPHICLQPGMNEIRISTAQYGIHFPPALYIIRLSGPDQYDSVKLLISGQHP